MTFWRAFHTTWMTGCNHPQLMYSSCRWSHERIEFVLLKFVCKLKSTHCLIHALWPNRWWRKGWQFATQTSNHRGTELRIENFLKKLQSREQWKTCLETKVWTKSLWDWSWILSKLEIYETGFCTFVQNIVFTCSAAFVFMVRIFSQKCLLVSKEKMGKKPRLPMDKKMRMARWCSSFSSGVDVNCRLPTALK